MIIIVKVLVGLASILAVGFLVSWYSGYYVSPYLAIDINPEQVQEISVASIDDDHKEYRLLTKDRQEIKQLINDLKWTWTTTLNDIPKNEDFIVIAFDSEGNPEGWDWIFEYYPKSDVLTFHTIKDYPKPITSINSSDVLKKLLKKNVTNLAQNTSN